MHSSPERLPSRERFDEFLLLRSYLGAGARDGYRSLLWSDCIASVRRAIETAARETAKTADLDLTSERIARVVCRLAVDAECSVRRGLLETGRRERVAFLPQVPICVESFFESRGDSTPRRSGAYRLRLQPEAIGPVALGALTDGVQYQSLLPCSKFLLCEQHREPVSVLDLVTPATGLWSSLGRPLDDGETILELRASLECVARVNPEALGLAEGDHQRFLIGLRSASADQLYALFSQFEQWEIAETVEEANNIPASSFGLRRFAPGPLALWTRAQEEQTLRNWLVRRSIFYSLVDVVKQRETGSTWQQVQNRPQVMERFIDERLEQVDARLARLATLRAAAHITRADQRLREYLLDLQKIIREFALLLFTDQHL